jgi:hypothetical protein
MYKDACSEADELMERVRELEGQKNDWQEYAASLQPVIDAAKEAVVEWDNWSHLSEALQLCLGKLSDAVAALEDDGKE